MAQTLYTITYNRTNMNNTTFSTDGSARARNLGLSNFAKSGNGVGKPIGRIVSITMASSWSCTNSSSTARTIKIRTTLVTSAGNISSAFLSKSIHGTVVRYTNTISGATANHIYGLSNIQLECAAYSTACDLYYRAVSAAPQTLTITFYLPTVKYGVDGEWIECEVYIGTNGSWIFNTMYWGIENVWKQTGGV